MLANLSEFVTSWSKDNSSSKASLCPSSYSGESTPAKEVSSAIEDDVEPGSMDESFPVENSKLQPALDRYAGKVSKDPYSHMPQGLQTSYSEEFGRSTMPIMEKHYKKEKAEVYRVISSGSCLPCAPKQGQLSKGRSRHRHHAADRSILGEASIG